MTNDEKIVEKIISICKTKQIITKDEISLIYKNNGIYLSDNALRKQIFNFKQKGLLTSIKRGVYSFPNKNIYKPNVEYYINKIRRIFTSSFPEIDYCIWSTAWMHDFMIHQPFKSFYIFELERDMLETTFYLFKDNGINVFNSHDKTVIEKYASEEKRAVILKKITSRSPLTTLQNNKVPTLEKMLVDLFCDKDIFYFYQGTELKNIFEQAIERYQINFSTLLSYASQRGKKKEIKKFILNNTQINKNILK